MLKRLSILFAVGILPLVVGVLLNFLIPYIPVYGLLKMLLDLALLVLWGYLSYRVASSNVNSVLQSVVLCAFGFVILALLLYQELALGHYWPNVIGHGSQMFFLPWLTLSSAIVYPFMSDTVITFAPIYSAAWCSMFVASCIGCILKCRVHK